MKSDVKKNLLEIVKYLLTLGVSAIVKLVQRKRKKKQQQQLVSDMASRPVSDQIAEAMYERGYIDPKP